jgi:hypothetical protein
MGEIEKRKDEAGVNNNNRRCKNIISNRMERNGWGRR